MRVSRESTRFILNSDLTPYVNPGVAVNLLISCDDVNGQALMSEENNY